MSFTLLGCTSATMAMYVAKAETHVGRVATSRISGSFRECAREGRASKRSFRATLSGSSSLMSTNSRVWIRLTIFGGTGGKLVASVNGDGAGDEAAVVGTPADHTVVVGSPTLPAMAGSDKHGAAPVDDRSGRAFIEIGRDAEVIGPVADTAAPPVG